MGRIYIVVSLLALGACSSHSSGDDGGGDDGPVTLTAVIVEPATAQLALAATGPTAWSAAQTYSVTAKYSDGTLTDVTNSVTWTADDSAAVAFPAQDTATVTAAGHYNLTAYFDVGSGTATIDASLHADGFGPGFAQADKDKLDGAPTETGGTIAYPVAGSLFPVNVAPIEVHAHKSSSQTLARITFSSGSALSYNYYAPCTASPNPGSFADACIVSITGAFAQQLAGASETADISVTVRMAAADGTHLSESAPISVAWAKTPLTGGLYYWTTAGTGDTTFNTAIARYNFDGDTTTPSIYLASNDAPTVPSDTQCVGCHAVSPDGSKMSFSMGGSQPGFFTVYDVATKTPTMPLSTRKYASMSTFNPDGSRIVTGSYGKLTLRTANATGDVITDDLFATTVTESKTHALWSPSGSKLAFVSWVPTASDITNQKNTGDNVLGGQIWITNADATGPMDTPTLLVPRNAAYTSYYPAISDDDRFVVFNQSSCAGPANAAGSWGGGACDGYQDISAKLMLIPSDGGTPVALTNANGGDSPLSTNSWPRWSPDHGTFRGKRLYWVAFSSRRPYGLALTGSTNDTAKPQLWFAAVAVDANGAAPAADPSFAPVWLPNQDPNLSGPRGNHTPAWTSKVVQIQ
ncbi:MAG TPA: hypothetical protein VGM90_02595 [Kofleriaceae bacterium]|jgi:hypothetical protein